MNFTVDPLNVTPGEMLHAICVDPCMRETIPASVKAYYENVAAEFLKGITQVIAQNADVLEQWTDFVTRAHADRAEAFGDITPHWGPHE